MISMHPPRVVHEQLYTFFDLMLNLNIAIVNYFKIYLFNYFSNPTIILYHIPPVIFKLTPSVNLCKR